MNNKYYTADDNSAHPWCFGCRRFQKCSTRLKKPYPCPWIKWTYLYWVNSALHPSGVAKSSTSFGWG